MKVTLVCDVAPGLPATAMAFADPAYALTSGQERWILRFDTETGEATARRALPTEELPNPMIKDDAP